MTISDIETAKRVLARAKRIKRRKLWRNINTLVKKRVYLFITLLILSLIFNYGLYKKTRRQIDTIDTTTHLMGKVLQSVEQDTQLLLNQELVHIIDSLQIMIFAYNMQYQEQLKTIQVLTQQPPSNYKKKYVLVKDTTNKININNDSLKIDTIN